jgi:hypothetical protein
MISGVRGEEVRGIEKYTRVLHVSLKLDLINSLGTDVRERWETRAKER